jgi:predicted DNA-binding transcriptional regulator AlpA
MIERENWDDYISQRYAAQICEVSVSTIRRWIKSERMPSFQLEGFPKNWKFYLRIDIEEMNEREKMRIVGKHF